MVKKKTTADSNRIPAFFKAFIPNTCTERLKIPPAFAEKIQGSLPEKAFLRDRYGNIWPVKHARIENATFFLEGWAKFVKDNSVELGDFLVFQFDGNCVFDVKLLGHTCCEKKGVGGYIFKVKEEEENEKEEDKKDERENLQNNYSTVDASDDDEEYEEEEEKEEELQVQEIAKSNKRAAKPKASGKALKGIKKIIKVDHKSGVKASGKALKGIKKIITVGHKSRVKASGKALKGIKKIIKFGHKSGVKASKRRDCYGFDLFKSGKVPQPKNPYFVTKVRARRLHELYVPIDVVRDHNLEFPPEILLRDPKKREWPARLRQWSDGRIWFSGGWRSLCRLNLVEEEDTCICEIVKRRCGGLRINVTIVRPEDLA